MSLNISVAGTSGKVVTVTLDFARAKALQDLTAPRWYSVRSSPAEKALHVLACEAVAALRGMGEG
jgi:hypothetical protein